MRRGLERALDECLSQLNTGELGLEEVLARYPEHEAELRPLLQVAMLVRQTPRAVPSREAKAAGRQQLLAAVIRKKRERVQAQPGLVHRLRQNVADLVQPWALPQRQPLRLAQAIAAVLVVISLVSVGTVRVAAGSLPDSPLYTIKRAAEQVQLALTSQPESKARLYMSYSEKRLEETRILWEAGKGLSEATLQAIESQNSGALTAISRVSESERRSLLGDFTLLTARQQAILQKMKPEMPPAEQEAVEEALEAAEGYQSVATKAMAEPDLLLTPSPMPRPTDRATSVPPTFTATAVPPVFTATALPATHTPKPVPTDTATLVPPTATRTPKPAPTDTPTSVPPTATPAPPTPTPVPTATPTPQAEVTFGPTAQPTATSTPQSELPPFKPTVDATAEPTPTVAPGTGSTPQSELLPFRPTVGPTVKPTATATATLVPTPIPTATPTPVPPAEPTPTAQAQAPFLPMLASLVMNFRVSDTPQGEALDEFPAGIKTIYIVFDYAYMAGEQVGIRAYDNTSKILFDEIKTLSGDGVVCIPFTVGQGGFAAGRYAVNVYHGGGVVRTVIWDVAP